MVQVVREHLDDRCSVPTVEPPPSMNPLRGAVEVIRLGNRGRHEKKVTIKNYSEYEAEIQASEVPKEGWMKSRKLSFDIFSLGRLVMGPAVTFQRSRDAELPRKPHIRTIRARSAEGSPECIILIVDRPVDLVVYYKVPWGMTSIKVHVMTALVPLKSEVALKNKHITDLMIQAEKERLRDEDHLAATPRPPPYADPPVDDRPPPVDEPLVGQRTLGPDPRQVDDLLVGQRTLRPPPYAPPAPPIVVELDVDDDTSDQTFSEAPTSEVPPSSQDDPLPPPPVRVPRTWRNRGIGTPAMEDQLSASKFATVDTNVTENDVILVQVHDLFVNARVKSTDATKIQVDAAIRTDTRGRNVRSWITINRYEFPTRIVVPKL